MQRHFDPVHSTNVSKRVVPTVVSGKVAAPFSKLAPHAIVIVPVAVIAIRSCCISVGVPLRLDVKLVMFPACAVSE